MHDLLANRPRGAQPVATHALAGQPAPVDVLIDVVELQDAYYRPPPDPRDARQPSPSAPAATAARRSTARSPRRTSWRSPRPSASTARGKGITGPLFLGKDTHALSAPAQRTALEVLAGQRRRGDHPAGRRRHADAGHLARHPRPQPRRNGPACADGIVITPVAQPAGRRRVQVQPAQRRPGRHRRHRRGSRTAPTRCSAPAARREARAVRDGASRAGRRTRYDFVAPYVDDLRQRRSTWTRSAPPA